MPVLQDPLKAQGFRTQRSELPEDLWQPLYDKVNHAAGGTTQMSFFSIPQGQTATMIRNGVSTANTVKGYLETNMQNANVVPTKMFKFVGITLAYLHLTEGLATNNQDRDRIRNGGYLNFRIVDKDLLFIPLTLIPEANPFVTAATTANATTICGQAGGGGFGVPMYKLPIPITLNPYENFAVTINFPTGIVVTSAVDITVALQGLTKHAVLAKSSLINGESLTAIRYKVTLSKQVKTVQLQRLSERTFGYSEGSDSPISMETWRASEKLLAA